MEEKRVCKTCKKEYPLTTEYFYKKGENRFSHECKSCRKIKDSEKYYKNKSNKKPIEFVENIEEWYLMKNNEFKDRWKYEDIKWMYDNYLNINKQELLSYFNNEIPYKTLTNIIYQWGMKKKDKNDNWSFEEIELLKNNYSNMTDKELKSIFSNRTNDAIRNKAVKLNLSKTEETIFRSNSESHKGYKFSEERKKEMSRKRKGINSVNWKGGLSPIIPYFRSIIYEWKMDSLSKYNYKCMFTDLNEGDIEIHHLYKNFNEMVYETFDILELKVYDNMTYYSSEQLKSINETFLKLHYDSGLGIPMKRAIHKIFHKEYGKNNNTKEQMDEFVKRYESGEFLKEIELIENNLKLKKHKPKNSKGLKFIKLKKEQVMEIKKLIKAGMPDRYVSKLYNVSDVAIYNIRNNKTWKNI